MTIQEIFLVLRKYAKMIAAFTLVALVAAVVINFMVLDSTYTAKSQLYVYKENADNSVSQSDLMVGEMLTKDYSELLKSRKVMEGTAKQLGLDDLEAYNISVAVKSGTRILEIAVEGNDQEGVARVANVLTANFMDCVMDVMQIDNISIIDPAVTPEKPSGPAKVRNVLLITLASLLFAIGVAFMLFFLDTTVKTVEDVENYLGLPVLAKVPEFAVDGGKK